jgi:hypothetical protein
MFRLGRPFRYVGFSPLGRAGSEQRPELVPADRVAAQEVEIGEAVALDDVEQCERERRIGPWKRLEVQVGGLRRRRPQRIDDDHRSGRLRQPVVVLVRSRRRRIRPPDEDARRILRRPGVESLERRPVHVAECRVAGEVADGVGLDLGGADPACEP